MSVPDTTLPNAQPISVGAGIAVAGVWLFAAILTTTMLTLLFTPRTATILTPMSVDIGWFVLVLLAAPSVLAYSVTKMIIGQKRGKLPRFTA
jgi:hypothetical protein